MLLIRGTLCAYVCVFFFHQSIDKNWVVDAPARVAYEAINVDPSKEEDKTQVVFITLTTVFVVIVVCCLIEVYRSDREYKKRLERETDEDIILSKEQAAKMQYESSTTNVKGFNYKAVGIVLTVGSLDFLEMGVFSSLALLCAMQKKVLSLHIHKECGKQIGCVLFGTYYRNIALLYCETSNRLYGNESANEILLNLSCSNENKNKADNHFFL